jgi:Spy/CpxP family protein refolding chaperone
MRKHVAAIMSILVASTVISVASAEPDRHGGDRAGLPGGGAQMSAEKADRMADRLGLDETQKQAIENIRLAAQPEFEALQEKMKALQEERKALADRVRSEVDAVLTDEQRSKLEEGRAGRDDRRDHKPGKGSRGEKDLASRRNN